MIGRGSNEAARPGVCRENRKHSLSRSLARLNSIDPHQSHDGAAALRCPDDPQHLIHLALADMIAILVTLAGAFVVLFQ